MKKTLDLSSKLAEFTVDLDLDSVPEQALENAKIAILDCLGVAVLATRQEIGTILLNFARNNIAVGACTIWGTALKTTPRDAALINGTLAHGLDYDDRNHSSTYTLAASFAAAEAVGFIRNKDDGRVHCRQRNSLRLRWAIFETFQRHRTRRERMAFQRYSRARRCCLFSEQDIKPEHRADAGSHRISSGFLRGVDP